MPADAPARYEIALVREQGALSPIAITGGEGDRVHAVSRTGKRLRLTPDRILWPTGRSLPAEEEARVAEALRRFDAAQDARAAEVDLAGLWEVLAGEVATVPIEELAPLWRPGADAEEAGVLLRAVVNDGLRFRLAGTVIEVRTPEQVQESLARREAAQREEALRRSLVDWMREGGHEPPPEGAASHLQALKDLAAAQMMPGHGDPGADLMQDAGFEPSPRAAFQLLVDRGVFSPDENLYLHRYGLLRPVPRAAREQADAVPPLPSPWPGGRLDLRHLPLLSIDDVETTEIDDALSVEVLPDGGHRVGVHIADPGAFVEDDSPLDRDAHKRATTVYLPERRIPMFPERLGSGPFSLVAGQDRPAMSFLLTLSPEGHLASFELVRSAVRVARRLDYGGVDDAFGADPELDLLRELADGLREARRAAGALMTQLPEVSVKVDAEGRIHLKRFPSRSPSREMVAEWMVWANHAVAQWAWQRRVPMPYRHQDPPDPPIPADLDPTDYVQVLLNTRKLGKTVVDRVPRRHYGLGIEGYVQVTSPIRRYLDLAAQRQLAAALEGRSPPLDDAGLRDLARHVETHTSRAAIAEAGSREYFVLKYLGAHAGATLRAFVLEDQGDRYRVYFPDYALRVPYRARRRLAVGDEIWLRVEGSEPRAGRLRLKEVDRPADPEPAP